MTHAEYMEHTQNSANILSLTHFNKYFNSNDKKLINDYTNICNIKKLCFYEEGIDWEDTKNNFNYEDPTDTFKSELNFENSYINIVTESHYEIKDIHITEKSFKPFYFYQFPIFLASYRHVEILKKEHPDLHLFEDIINYDYDLEIDDKKRLQMVLDEIVRLSKLKNEIKNYYKNNKDKFIKNYEYVSKYGLSKSTEKYFYNLI
jgi:hypothetical protein